MLGRLASSVCFHVLFPLVAVLHFFLHFWPFPALSCNLFGRVSCPVWPPTCEWPPFLCTNVPGRFDRSPAATSGPFQLHSHCRLGPCWLVMQIAATQDSNGKQYRGYGKGAGTVTNETAGMLARVIDRGPSR